MEEIRKKYSGPVVEVIGFGAADVITTSPEENEAESDPNSTEII